MENDPKKKELRIFSFAVHATRGLIRDQTTRRMTMFVILITALVLLCIGATVLKGMLSPKEHPGWFIGYWFVCAWLTFVAFLLALFDLLIVRAQARAARKLIRSEFANPPTPGSPSGSDGE